MKKTKDKATLAKIFWFMLAVTIVVTLAAATFIVFSFLRMAKMELYTCLVTGLCMAIILVFVSITLWLGINTFRE